MEIGICKDSLRELWMENLLKKEKWLEEFLYHHLEIKVENLLLKVQIKEDNHQIMVDENFK